MNIGRDYIKSIWPAAKAWRLNDGNLEFALKTIGGSEEWFSVYRSPQRVQDMMLRLLNLGEEFNEK